jgi:hypothetical protein
MDTPETPKKATEVKSRARKVVKKPVVRKRAVKKKVQTVENALTDSPNIGSAAEGVRRVSSGKLEHLAILGVALLFGACRFRCLLPLVHLHRPYGAPRGLDGF